MAAANAKDVYMIKELFSQVRSNNTLIWSLMRTGSDVECEAEDSAVLRCPGQLVLELIASGRLRFIYVE